MDKQEVESNFLTQLPTLVEIPELHLRKFKKQFSLNSHDYDLLLQFSYGGKKFSLVCEIKSTVRSITLENFFKLIDRWSSEAYKPCLIVPYLPDFFREYCKKKDISYIDLSGNLFIRIPELLYIERDGRPNRYKESTKTTGPFSDKKSLIIRYLIEHAEKYSGVREIATACDINPGGVSHTLYFLEQSGYITRNAEGHGRLLKWKELLADWVSFYRLKKQKEHTFYWHKGSLNEMIRELTEIKKRSEKEIVLTIHAAASLIAPHTNYQGLHAYVRNEVDIEYWTKLLNLLPAEKGGNVFLRIPYYKYSAFYGLQKIKGIDVVSDIQLYLDLSCFPVRGQEQAEYLMRKRIQPVIEKKLIGS
jgi:DNA-binding transcriptional regulator YhcF (GntR family)